MSDTVLRNRKFKAGRQGGFENVGAKNQFDLFPYRESDSPRYTWMDILSFTGRHLRPSWAQMVFNFLLEIVGSFLLGLTVSLTVWAAFGLQPLLAGAVIGLVYAGTWYGASRWITDLILRRHLNGAISMGYFLTGDIGLAGLLMYAVAQYLGSSLAGLVMFGILGNSVTAMTVFPTAGMPAVGQLFQSTIPVPLATFTTLTTVCCLEIFGGAIIVFSLLANEYITGKPEPADGSPELISKYRDASLICAFTLFAFVALGYQFQVFSFNNVPYFAGLLSFAYFPTSPADARTLSVMSLGQWGISSVFNGHGGAFALYLFGPYAAGLIGAGIFWALFAARFMGPKEYQEEGPPSGTAYVVLPRTDEEKAVDKSETLTATAPSASQINSKYSSLGARQTQLADLVVPFRNS